MLHFGQKAFRFIYLLFVFMPLHLMVPLAMCVENNPDKLYKNGRFLEAEDLYSRLSIENPDNLTYRFNMGCCAYKRSQYILAEACFFVVLTQTDDEPLRFKAAYNLGNVKFNQKNYFSAVTWYKKALQYNPDDANARFNLALALKKLGQNKKEDHDNEKDNKDSENSKKDREKSLQDQAAAQDLPGSNDLRDNTPPPGLPIPPEAGFDEKPLEDVSGELEARSPMPVEQKESQNFDAKRSPMNRKKAEALLDNISEDHSRFLRPRMPEGKKRGGRSMKDW